MMRKGLMKGSGRRGYYNVIGKDPIIHRQSAMGIKQPQKINYYIEYSKFPYHYPSRMIHNSFEVATDKKDAKEWERTLRKDPNVFNIHIEKVKKSKNKGGKIYPHKLFYSDEKGKNHVFTSCDSKAIKRVQDYVIAEGGSIEKVQIGGKLPFGRQGLNIFELPIENAIYVPSTDKNQNRITDAEFSQRVAETETFLSNLYGGYTSYEERGGYTDAQGKLIMEKGARVASFSTKDNTTDRNKSKQLKKFLMQKNKEWGQEAIGYEKEGDLFYISPKGNKK